jgi:hypothetical protein
MPIAANEIKEIAANIFSTAKILAAYAPKEADTLDWKLTTNAKNKLKELNISGFLIKNDKLETPVRRQVHLRENIKRYLVSPADQANHSQIGLFKWIVRDWGNIKSDRGNDEKFENWVKALNAFKKREIDNFIRLQGTDGIASWSKIISFANYNYYAIYDARVAASLNIILSYLGINNYRFYLPPSQNSALAPSLVLLNIEIERLNIPADSLLTYDDYLTLLKAMPAPAGPQKLLKLEMFLFAIAPELAIKYWIGRRDSDQLLPRDKILSMEKDFTKPVKLRINALSGYQHLN